MRPMSRPSVLSQEQEQRQSVRHGRRTSLRASNGWTNFNNANGAREADPTSDAIIVVCGPPGFVDKVESVLKDVGVPMSKVLFLD